MNRTTLLVPLALLAAVGCADANRNPPDANCNCTFAAVF